MAAAGGMNFEILSQRPVQCRLKCNSDSKIQVGVGVEYKLKFMLVASIPPNTHVSFLNIKNVFPGS